MSTILQKLKEQADNPSGSYVGSNIEGFNKTHKSILDAIKNIDGSKISNDKLHTTVIYSKKFVEEGKINDVLNTYQLPIIAKIIGADSFDALPDKDGKKAENVSSLVLKLDCPELLELHASMKELGCTHTYDQLSPHVSLAYGVPTEQCKDVVNELNKIIKSSYEPLTFSLNKLYTEPIESKWGEKNAK